MGKSIITKEQRNLIIIAFFGTFVCFFNQTTINPAYPTIMKDFGINASDAQWLLSGYLMIMAIVVPINAFLIEKFCIKKICSFALGIYTAGCIITGLGINFPLTFVGRIFQGIGHGVLMPTTMAAMLYIYPVERRGVALGIYGLLIGFAPVFGPFYSGIVVDCLGWHFVYYGVGIFAFLCFIACILKMPKINLTAHSNKKLDVISIITSTLGLALVLYSCAAIGVDGFTVTAISVVIFGIIVLAFFVWRQSKIDNPMLKISVFKYRNFGVSMVVLSICQLAFMGAVVLFPFLIQNVLGNTPTMSGLVMIPSALVMGFMSPVTGKLFDKYGIRFIAPFGMAVLTIAGLCLSSLTEYSPIWLLIIFLCARNFGASFVLMNINTWGINSLPEKLIPHANAMSSTIRLVAMSFGSAISTSVYTLVANNMPGGIDVPSAGIVGINASFGYQSILCLLGFILCLIFVKDKVKQ